MKNFADNYPIEVVYCGGDPRLVIMDDQGNEIEEIELYDKNEQQIMDLLESKGINKIKWIRKISMN